MRKADPGKTAPVVDHGTPKAPVLPEALPPDVLYGRPRPPEVSLEEVRALYAGECFALLREPAIWNSLRRLLTCGSSRSRLAAFEVVLSILVPHTKPEERSRQPVQLQIVNNVARPPVGTVIEVPE